MAGRPKKEIKFVRELQLNTKLKELRTVWYETLKRETTLDLDEWSDLYRIIPSEASSEPGPWVTQRFPFLRRIMKCLSPSSIAEHIAVMKGNQLGFTEVSICWELYKAVCWPGPSLYSQKTDDDCKDFSNQRLKPSIHACEAVYEILGKGKPKHYANSWDNKAYPGGFFVLGGATDNFLKSKPVRTGTMDEEDGYDLNIGKQGAPHRLLAKRMVNFPDKKLYRLSTPVLKELSTIEPAFERGSQERYYVPCPHCNPEGDENGFMFWLKWSYIKWSKELTKEGYPADTWLECPNCAEAIYETVHKTWMLDNGDWFSVKGFEDEIASTPEEEYRLKYRVGDVKNPTFHISALYSPLGFFSWSEAVEEWFDYKKTNDINLLQVFINQTLAETFELEGHELSYNHLFRRRERYCSKNEFMVPLNALCLTAGVDVQDDRLELEVVGWGLFDENWSIDYVVIPGDTAMMGNRNGMLQSGQPSVWRLLDEYLSKTFVHASGVEMPIEVTMIDAQHNTHEVRTFCRLREHRRIFPVHGKEGWGKGLWAVTRRRHDVYKTFDYTAYTDELKTRLYAQLAINDPGPSFCHFPRNHIYSEKYFKGLTSETKDVKLVNGKKKLYWRLAPGARNEPLDCRNYATVALFAYPVDLKSRFEKGLGKIFPAVGTNRGTYGQKPRRRRRGSTGL